MTQKWKITVDIITDNEGHARDTAMRIVDAVLRYPRATLKVVFEPITVED